MIFSYHYSTCGFTFHTRGLTVRPPQRQALQLDPARSYRQQTVFHADNESFQFFLHYCCRLSFLAGLRAAAAPGPDKGLQYPVVALPWEIRAFLSVSRRKTALLGNERSLNRSAPQERTNKIPSKQSSSLTFCLLLSTNETCCNFLSLTQNYFY